MHHRMHHHHHHHDHHHHHHHHRSGNAANVLAAKLLQRQETLQKSRDDYCKSTNPNSFDSKIWGICQVTILCRQTCSAVLFEPTEFMQTANQLNMLSPKAVRHRPTESHILPKPVAIAFLLINLPALDARVHTTRDQQAKRVLRSSAAGLAGQKVLKADAVVTCPHHLWHDLAITHMNGKCCCLNTPAATVVNGPNCTVKSQLSSTNQQNQQ